jgi:hypothetical protein
MRTTETVVRRALPYSDWGRRQGGPVMHSYVDVGDPRLLAVDALSEVSEG